MTASPFSFDNPIFLALNFDGGVVIDRLMWLFSAKAVWAPLYLFLLWMIWRKWGWRYVLVVLLSVVVGVVAGDQICNFFKDTFQVPRPNRVAELQSSLHLVWDPIKERFYTGGHYGTVSAHAATTMAIYLIIGHALGNKKLYWWLMGAWVVMVGWSRIYMAAHFPSQVLFGWMLGALLSVAILWLAERVFPRAKSPQNR
jgi:undecaprenyl-diphosphatase